MLLITVVLRALYQDVIQKGGDRDLPAFCDLMKQKHMEGTRVSIEGHVNFGQSKEEAKKLSEVCSCVCVYCEGFAVALCPCAQVYCFPPQGRARQIKIRMTSLGLDKSRIDAVGHGYTKPR